MSKILICFDFDGTLVNKNGIIHTNDIEILKNEKRVYFIPTTGRPLHSVKNLFSKYNLFYNAPIPFPLILQNGAVIYFPYEKLYKIFPINQEELNVILKVSKIERDLTILLFSIDKVFTQNLIPYAKDFITRFNLNTQPLNSKDILNKITKIMLISKNQKILSKIVEKLKHINIEVSFSLSSTLEINQIDVNKAKSLSLILKELNLDKEYMVAAGDGENDIPLFNLADLTFCPENSFVSLKNIADYIINVNKEGVFMPIFKKIDLN